MWVLDIGPVKAKAADTRAIAGRGEFIRPDHAPEVHRASMHSPIESVPASVLPSAIPE